VPYFEIEAAAGPFGDEQNYVDEISEHETWLRIEDTKLTPDMFAIRILGVFVRVVESEIVAI